MKRPLLFLATNAAVLVVLSTVFQVFGLEQWLYQTGTDINLLGLLLFSALFGMGGSFVSLALSKSMAKTTMGVQVILNRLLMSHPPLEYRIATIATLQRAGAHRWETSHG